MTVRCKQTLHPEAGPNGNFGRAYIDDITKLIRFCAQLQDADKIHKKNRA